VGSSDDYVSLMNWIKNNNLENEENYAYIASKIDIDNYINYMQVEMFAYNHDWPGNNLKKWNCTNPQTRWKWFLYDLDVTFGQIKEGNNLSNVFEYVLTENSDYHDNKPKYTFLFRSFFKNEKFRTAFINRMLALLQMNFESSRVLAQIEKKMNEIEVEIPRDQKRWLYDSSKMAEQLEIVKRFVIDRPSIIVKDLQVYFKLNEIIPITLSVNGNGNILVHNLPLDGTPLTISFFKGFPVTLTAEPHDGSSWSHWSDGDTSATRIILPNKAQTLMAIFK